MSLFRTANGRLGTRNGKLLRIGAGGTGCCPECAPDILACCLPNGSCLFLTNSECVLRGGLSLPEGTGCNCCLPPGTVACCFPGPPDHPETALCLETTTAECDRLGGVNLGGIKCQCSNCDELGEPESPGPNGDGDREEPRSQPGPNGETIESSLAPVGTKTKIRLDCIHRGEQTGERECKSCAGSVRLKVFGCDLHQQTTIALQVDDLACCATCNDYEGKEQ